MLMSCFLETCFVAPRYDRVRNTRVVQETKGRALLLTCFCSLSAFLKRLIQNRQCIRWRHSSCRDWCWRCLAYHESKKRLIFGKCTFLSGALPKKGLRGRSVLFIAARMSAQASREESSKKQVGEAP